MSALYTRLAQICREHLLTEKILVVPSLAIGHQIADAIAHSGTPWVNLRVETVRTLSDGVAGFTLAREGVTVLSRAQALAIVERACDQALDSSSYFAALAGRPGLHRAIQRSLDDLRHAGVDRSLELSAFEDPRKGADLLRVLSAYNDEMRTGNYVDRFAVLARAIGLLESGAASAWQAGAMWLVADGLELTSTEERFLSLLGPPAKTTGVRSKVERQLPLFERPSSTAESAGVRSKGESLLSTFDLTPEVRDVKFRQAVGEENEIRGIFRALLAANGSGQPASRFDEAELVYSTRDPYLPLAYELAAEYEVPCTFAEGIPAYFTRPGQACLSFLAWLGEGWQASELQRAATAGSLRLDAISGAAFARILRSAVIGWGRDRYALRLDALLADRREAFVEEEDETRRGHIAKAIDHIHASRAIVDDLLTVSEDLAEGVEIDPSRAAHAAALFVKKFAAIRSEIDGMARDALVRMLGELAVLPGTTVDRRDVSARLAEAVKQVHVSASNPRPGHLHVAPIRAGGWSGRPRMFVAGLDEERHPGSGLQDPIVLDAERLSINSSISPRSLLLLGDAPQRATRKFEELLARAAAREVTLSYCALDLTTRRERFPSASLLALYRKAPGRELATYEEVGTSIARDAFVDPDPLSATEWWLMRRFADGDADITPALHRVYAGLAGGAAAGLARQSDELTPWDGLVAGDATRLDPRLNDRVYSASQLETMARCPFRYFLDRVLNVKAIEELVFNPDQWLEAHQFGTMLHDVLETTMKRLCAGGLKPSLASLPLMESVATTALAEWKRLVPPPSDAAFERRHTELMDSCEIFLRNEEVSCRTLTPKYFEVSFGMGEDGPGTIAMPEPLVIPLSGGRSLKLRGRIDRIDHDEERDQWQIWDYKSGSTYEYDKGGQLTRGTKVQHAIYTRAVETMLARKGEKGSVVSSGYYFPTPKGRGARFVPRVPDGQFEQALDALCDVVGGGFFPHAAPKGCAFCDFESVCGGSEFAGSLMQQKLAANPDDPRVAAWLRLQGVR